MELRTTHPVKASMPVSFGAVCIRIAQIRSHLVVLLAKQRLIPQSGKYVVPFLVHNRRRISQSAADIVEKDLELLKDIWDQRAVTISKSQFHSLQGSTGSIQRVVHIG